MIASTTIRLEDAEPPLVPDGFSGTVRMQVLTDARESLGMDIVAVFFEAGARTRPHLHAVDQVLHIVEGEGIVANEADRQIVRAGDVVTIPGGVWHWHGATRTTAMCHISLKRTPTGKTEWDVPVGNWSDY